VARRVLRNVLSPALALAAVAAGVLVLVPKKPAYEVTFFLASDPHYGAGPEVAAANRKIVDAMNRLPGTAYPPQIGGVIGQPRGVAVLGDLINDAASPQASDFWQLYTGDFGVDGEGRLKFPVYENSGNHDGGEDQIVRQGIRERNKVRRGLTAISPNGINYSWDWEAVHFVNLGLYAGSEGETFASPWGRRFEGSWRLPGHSLEFLADDLARNVGRSGRPVVLMQHYGWDVWGMGWWSDRERQALADVIKEYRVIAVFWGHTHTVQRVDVEGIPTFCVGSSQAGRTPGSFMVVRIRPKEMIVAERKTDGWGLVDRLILRKRKGTRR